VPSDALIMIFPGLSAEVLELVQLFKWPRYFIYREINCAIPEPLAHGFRLFDLAVMFFFVFVGQYLSGVLGLVVPCKISTRNVGTAILATLFTFPFCSSRSHTEPSDAS
jgi:hypothetical protein